jgi:pyruvate/2-oxoglutarate dehydrogenase complex dihydrolipoamide dehydrogenase (E3) component
VLGGGTAGLVASIGAAAQGARVTLVERARTGGDCLWTGCVPSKALIAAAAAAQTARASGHLGVHAAVRIEPDEVFAHVRRAIRRLEPHNSPARLAREGVTLLTGDARFVADDTVAVDTAEGARELGFHRAMVATGAAPARPDVPGLAAADPWTSETMWDAEEIPQRLVVLGGGSIGCELGQAFSRLGSQVTVVEADARLLPREEPEASAVVAAHLRAEGVAVRTGVRAAQVEPAHRGWWVRLEPAHGGQEPTGPGSAGRGTDRPADDGVAADRILVAVGRAPRTAGLGLEAAGVATDERGAVVVDARQRTSNPRVYAGGDVTLQLPFTHVAAAHAATIVQGVFGLRAKVDHDRIPQVVFTAPEVARVGPTVTEARRRHGGEVQVRGLRHDELDRAVTAGATTGFAQLVADRAGHLLGATVVGPRAGETIAEVVAWLTQGAKLGTIARAATHAYPTWTEDVATASLEHLRTSLARLRPATRAVLSVRRRLDRPG